MALKKLCSKCNKVIDYGQVRCNKCEEEYQKQKKVNYKYYDNNIRDKKSKDFYDSTHWKRVKKSIHVRDNGVCVMCKDENRRGYADVVHHIIPLKEAYDKSLSYSNLICLCASHHRQVHKAYDTNELNKSNMQKKLFNLIKISEEEF